MVIKVTTSDETVICGLHNLSAPVRTNGHVHECMYAFLNDPNFSFWAEASAGRRAAPLRWPLAVERVPQHFLEDIRFAPTIAHCNIVRGRIWSLNQSSLFRKMTIYSFI